MLQQTSAPNNIVGSALGISVLAVALLVGLIGGLFGWEAQLLLFSIAVPLVLLLVDYRVGVILAIAVLPYVNSKLVPSAGPLSVTNVLVLGVCASFALRWVLRRTGGRPLAVPVGRELFWLYLVPVTLAMLVGSLHLDEISVHYMSLNKMASYGLKDYWLSMYLKMMLMVAFACVLGAGIVQHGKGMRFVVATVVSGVLFVAAIVAVVVSTGASLQQLQNARDLLKIIGRHNNEAGALLLGVMATTLFMREYVRHAGMRLVLLAALLIMAAGLALTMSRGAILGLAVVMIFFVWYFRRPGLVLGSLIISVAAVAVAPDAIVDRMMLGFEGRSVHSQVSGSVGNDQLSQGRFWIWSQVAGEILKSPAIGRGVLSTQWSTAARTGVYYGNHPHNLYLEILMDLGILGGICIALFYRYLWRLFRRLANDDRLSGPLRGYFLGSAAGMLGMFAYGFTNGHYYPAPEQLFFWVGIGMALGYQRWLAAQPAPLVPVSTTRTQRPRFRVPETSLLKPKKTGALDLIPPRGSEGR